MHLFTSRPNTLAIPGALRAPGTVAFAACVALAPLHAGADVVHTFNVVGSSTINAAGLPAVTPQERRPVLPVDIATLNVAMYDAIVAIEGQYKPFAVVPVSPAAGASVDAAGAAAACTVLQQLFPNRSSRYATDCATFLANIPEGDAKAKGIALGTEVALGVVSMRANDGRWTPVTYTPGNGAGDFRPNPPGSTPINVFMPYMVPFALDSISQFRADGPPALDSEQYAADFEESKAMGVAGGPLLTEEQKEIARFHTENPSFFLSRNFTRLLADARPVVDNARLAAMIWVVNADVSMACFESKYHFDFWRPRTAIPEAASDRNPSTVADPGWQPFVPTPNHPEYPAAHGCVGGGFAETLRQFHGTKKVAYLFDSTVTNTTHTFDSTDDYLKESVNARIWGGMHWRTSAVHGLVLGRKVAHYVLRTRFQPLARGNGGGA